MQIKQPVSSEAPGLNWVSCTELSALAPSNSPLLPAVPAAPCGTCCRQAHMAPSDAYRQPSSQPPPHPACSAFPRSLDLPHSAICFSPSAGRPVLPNPGAACSGHRQQCSACWSHRQPQQWQRQLWELSQPTCQQQRQVWQQQHEWVRCPAQLQGICC